MNAEMKQMQPQAKEWEWPPETGRARNETLSWRFQKDHNPAETLTSNFWAPKLWENKFLLF